MAMYSLNMIQWNNVVAASLIFLIIVLVLVIVLLVAKRWLVNSGEVAISMPHLEKTECISRRHAAEKEAAVNASCR